MLFCLMLFCCSLLHCWSPSWASAAFCCFLLLAAACCCFLLLSAAFRCFLLLFAAFGCFLQLSAVFCCFSCCFPKANHDATVGFSAAFCCFSCCFPKANHDATVRFFSRTRRAHAGREHSRSRRGGGPLWSIFCGTL